MMTEIQEIEIQKQYMQKVAKLIENKDLKYTLYQCKYSLIFKVLYVKITCKDYKLVIFVYAANFKLTKAY